MGRNQRVEGAFQVFHGGPPGRGNRVPDQILLHNQKRRDPVQCDLQTGVSFGGWHSMLSFALREA